ncbi:hypothetical protein BDR07DRAFT_1379903 [Suillus spraguei]|nr:hypothetical protein BDR07DRAFT_1379903 [Suillus spraguei]
MQPNSLLSQTSLFLKPPSSLSSTFEPNKDKHNESQCNQGKFSIHVGASATKASLAYMQHLVQPRQSHAESASTQKVLSSMKFTKTKTIVNKSEYDEDEENNISEERNPQWTLKCQEEEDDNQCHLHTTQILADLQNAELGYGYALLYVRGTNKNFGLGPEMVQQHYNCQPVNKQIINKIQNSHKSTALLNHFPENAIYIGIKKDHVIKESLKSPRAGPYDNFVRWTDDARSPGFRWFSSMATIGGGGDTLEAVTNSSLLLHELTTNLSLPAKDDMDTDKLKNVLCLRHGGTSQKTTQLIKDAMKQWTESKDSSSSHTEWATIKGMVIDLNIITKDIIQSFIADLDTTFASYNYWSLVQPYMFIIANLGNTQVHMPWNETRVAGHHQRDGAVNTLSIDLNTNLTGEVSIKTHCY